MSKVVLSAALIWGTLSTFSGAEYLNIAEFIDKASITYKTHFTVDTPLERWNLMFDNPLLIGTLWELYTFSPPYRVSRKGSGYHINDSKGIEGDLYEIYPGNDHTRVFWGNGTLKNWFIPVSLSGKALFILDYTVTQKQVLVALSIYGESGDDIITTILLKTLSPLICTFVDRRVTQNLRDLKIIISDIEHNPDKIRAVLPGEIIKDFNRLCMDEITYAR